MEQSPPGRLLSGFSAGILLTIGNVAASSSEQIVESRHQAVAAQGDPVALGCSGNRALSVDVGGSAEVGMHELEAQRNLAGHLVLDAGAGGPAVVDGRALRRYAQCIALDARLDVPGGEAAFDIGQP